MLHHVLKQNVDGLHEAAGSKNVIALHGTPDALLCLSCGARRTEKIAALSCPPRCVCGAVLKPDVVLFGEELPKTAIESAQDLAARCDVCLVIGTSAQVYPAATIPQIAFTRGSIVCEINVEATSLTHTGRVRRFLQGSAGAVLPRLVGLLDRDGVGAGIGKQ